MSNPLVSVIIPVYKVERYIRQCVDSVLCQTYENLDIILVDDGSPDSCPKICDSYARKDKRVKVIHQSNQGQSCARNAGIESASGDYITFLDSDDFWHSQYVEILMKHALESKADLVQCSFLRGHDTVFPSINLSGISTRIYDNHSIFTSHASNVIIWGKLYKSTLWNGIRMPAGKIHEDDFTSWKIYYKAKKIAVVGLPLYYYTENPTSTMSNAQKTPHVNLILEAYDERIKFFANTGDQDLEDISRFQLCKSLLLTTGNKNLGIGLRQVVKDVFMENWKHIRKSRFVPAKFHVLYYMYRIWPTGTSRLSSLLR